jgi:hypothetical protein
VRRGLPATVTGLGLVALMAVVYVASHPARYNQYNHFVWQAAAYLEGEASIRYPVADAGDGSPSNDYFNDVQPVVDAEGNPTGRALLPFPPLPAVILLPFVAAWGLTTNAQLIASLLGALDVGLCFWMLGRLGIGLRVRAAVTVFFGLGTVFWYTAEEGTTWFLAHVVAVGLLLMAVGLALDADRTAAAQILAPAGRDDAGRDHQPDGYGNAGVGWPLGPTWIDGRQFLAGFLLGLAASARLTVILAAPFFVFVGGGGNWRRRGVSAALGAAIPVGGLILYNLVSSGHLFNPVYDVLYRQEAEFYTFLNYHPDWSIEDPRYIPQNLFLMFLNPPELLPTTLQFGTQLCVAPTTIRGWFEPGCPILMPNPTATGLLLTSPAYLLAIPALRWIRRSRLVAGSVVAILLVGLVNVMHFSQGWVQFGYRFSLDFAPFALILVALGLGRLWRDFSRTGPCVIAAGLIFLSILVNAWGVWWGGALGW